MDELFLTPDEQVLQQEKALADAYKAGLAVTSDLDLSKVLRATMESIAKILSADIVTLYFYDQEKEDFLSLPITTGASTLFEHDRKPTQTGSAAIIAKNGKPIIANYAIKHPEINQSFIESEQITSSAGFPLKVGEKTVGVLFLNYHNYHEFTLEDIANISIFANQAAIAIHSAELFRQQEAATAANKQLQILRQAQKAIDSATELQEVLEQILTEGLKIVATGRGSLMLIEGEDLTTKAQFGPEITDPGRKTMTFKVGEGIVGYVAETGQAVLCPDVFSDARFKRPPEGRDIRFRSLLAVPIISHEGKVLGVINADDPEVNHFDKTHKELLVDMAGQFAAAIEKMVLVDTLDSLHKIFESITSVAIVDRELQPVLEEIARNAQDVLKIDIITIYQYDQGHGTFIVPPLMKGILEDSRMETEVFEGEAPWVLVHQLRKNHYAPDAQTDSIMNPQRPLGKGPGFVTRQRIKSSAGLLLKVGEEVVGVMFINYRFSHQFLKREQQSIQTFANSAAIAIQDVRQWENLKKSQDQLIQTARIREVGNMTSGIAHNLRNPLANILSLINLLETDYIPQSEIPLKLEEMKNEVLRARNIINSLLGYVQPAPMNGTVNIYTLVQEAVNLLRNEAVLHHIHIDETLLREVPLIQGDATRLKEVFVNILKNAIEAMPNGGNLRVSTGLMNATIRVEIQDNGAGILPVNRQHIFEPFFTTKGAGSGTGLGLAISSSIIHEHRGDIKVESEMGQGTAFIITLPVGE